MGATNILIADSNYQDRALFKEIIYQFDKRIIVDTASNSAELFHRLTAPTVRRVPDLLVLQYELPGADALQILERIYLLEPYANVVKLVWGTLLNREIVDRCRKWGALDYFSKIIQPSALKRLIKDVLQTLSPVC
jgi:CheY-like chemotaxis protein